MASRHLNRRISEVLVARTAESAVVALQGARSVGKSTVLAVFASTHGVPVIDFDDPATVEQAADDPSILVAGRAPVCIDEYQRAPLVLDAMKAELNRRHDPGRFVITGSTRYDALPQAAQSLTGRLQLLEIMPFSQGEIDGVREDFLATVLEDPDRILSTERSVTTRDDYIARVCRGGFPIAIAAASAGARRRWFESFLTTSLQRDVLDLARIRQAEHLPRLLARLAGQTAQVVNITKAATDAGLEPRTGDTYARLLEALFLVRRLPAWGRTLRARAVAMPKLHVVDSGLASHLLRLDPTRLAQVDPTSMTEFGHLLETFVVGELLKQASWLDDIVGAGHWRTHDGQEVDLVIERHDGAVACFEVKASRRVTHRDARGLTALRETLGPLFHCGVILSTGEASYRLGDRIYVVPIDRLWTAAGRSVVAPAT